MTIVVTDRRFQKLPKKLRIAGALFLAGAKNQFAEQSLPLGAIAGISMGTKYKGDVKRGIITGAVVTATLATVRGVSNVIANIGKDIQEVVVDNRYDDAEEIKWT